MKKRHTIELTAFQQWLLETTATYAQCNTKLLEIKSNGGMRIRTKAEHDNWANSKVEWEGMQPFSAVEKYNSLP